MNKIKKVIVIGLDGATWNLIEPWADKGDLPTIKQLMLNNTWGNLESTIPFFTSPAWKSYSTGKNPGKLGVYSWWVFNSQQKKVHFANSNSFKSREMWDYLSDTNYKNLVINMPMTYPTKKINGLMIGGVPSPDKAVSDYPVPIRDILLHHNYSIHPSISVYHSLERGLEDVIDLINARFKVTKKLMIKEEPDFVHLTIFYIDEIQHAFWKYMETKDKRYGNAIKRCWKTIDSNLANLFNFLDDDWYIFLMSDHGFDKLIGIFYLNTWLEKEGYLIFKSEEKTNDKSHTTKRMREHKITKERVIGFLVHIRVWDVLKKVVPSKFRKIIPIPKETGIDFSDAITQIDWNKTKAFGVSHGLIFLNPDIADIDKREKLKRDLSNKLSMLKDPRNKEHVIADVMVREKLYWGPYVKEAPDLTIVPVDGYDFRGDILSKMWDFSRIPWSGYHKLHGIFLACGSGIRKNKKVENLKIYDIAPTILHIFGNPIPTDIDGRVLKEIFEENSEFMKRKIVYSDYKDEKLKIQEKVMELKRLKKV